jgi:hypothetical protein
VSDVLVRIKRAVLAGRYRFSEKASEEMEESGLTELDVVESIVTAKRVYKRIRSTSPWRMGKREYLYVIQSTSLTGIPIYTKGKFSRQQSEEVYYFLVSSKRAE